MASALFAWEARISLVSGLVVLVVLRALAAKEASREPAFKLSQTPAFWRQASLWVLAAVLATILGQDLVQPLMAQARAGQGALSFAVLHSISSGLFLLKMLCVLVLALRLSAFRSQTSVS